MSNGVKTLLIIFAVIALTAILTIMWGVSQYNQVVAMDEQVKSQWAQVENQLKRRYDLIPKTCGDSQGLCKTRKRCFYRHRECADQILPGEHRKGQDPIIPAAEGVLSRLLMLQEAYPQLKANESFLKLQDSLEGTENRIAVERKRYNDDVKTLDTYRRTVFGKFIASLAGVNKRSTTKSADRERNAQSEVLKKPYPDGTAAFSRPARPLLPFPP